MTRHNPEADRFIADLEGLLQAAREAAAATLLSEATQPRLEGPGPPPLTLYSCAVEGARERLRVVVQLLGQQAIYEGTAEGCDWAEPAARTGARAALAALREWNPRLELGLGDVLEPETRQGRIVVVTVAVREGAAERWVVGSGFVGDGAAAAGARAALQAFMIY